MMQLSDQAANPAWPGIKLAEGQVPVLPAAGKGSKVAAGKEWGCPVGPIIVPGAPWEAAPGPPDEREVEMACGSLLNTGCMAETALNADSLQRKWNGLLGNPSSIMQRKPDKKWPTAALGPPEGQAAKKGITEQNM